MKKTAHLISLARKLAFKNMDKFAIDANAILPQIKESLEKALENASTRPGLGIMPFITMLSQDNASLAFDVTRSGSDITVNGIQTNPTTFAAKYAPLAQQVKTYLEKYINVFPTTLNGDSVDYGNLTVHLIFMPRPQEVAGN